MPLFGITKGLYLDQCPPWFSILVLNLGVQFFIPNELPSCPLNLRCRISGKAARLKEIERETGKARA